MKNAIQMKATDQREMLVLTFGAIVSYKKFPSCVEFVSDVSTRLQCGEITNYMSEYTRKNSNWQSFIKVRS